MDIINTRTEGQHTTCGPSPYPRAGRAFTLTSGPQLTSYLHVTLVKSFYTLCTTPVYQGRELHTCAPRTNYRYSPRIIERVCACEWCLCFVLFLDTYCMCRKNLLCFLFLLYRMLPSITISLTFFLLDTCFSPIPKPSSLVSWSQICLSNSIAVFETVRSYQ